MLEDVNNFAGAEAAWDVGIDVRRYPQPKSRRHGLSHLSAQQEPQKPTPDTHTNAPRAGTHTSELLLARHWGPWMNLQTHHDDVALQHLTLSVGARECARAIGHLSDLACAVTSPVLSGAECAGNLFTHTHTQSQCRGNHR